ncbi:MAG: hypothetical protein L6V85_00470 [Clostridiales bacterium]|nr:MAG: hypothetical protein L6V85_00470 [Clostridiales bacterium]
MQDGVLVSVEKGNYTLKDKCDAVSGVLRGNRRGFAFLISDDGKSRFVHTAQRVARRAKRREGLRRARERHCRRRKKSFRSSSAEKRQLVGEYTSDRAGHGFVIPDDESYFSDVFIPTAGRGGAKNKDKVVVNIYDWDSGKKIPLAKSLRFWGAPTR